MLGDLGCNHRAGPAPDFHGKIQVVVKSAVSSILGTSKAGGDVALAHRDRGDVLFFGSAGTDRIAVRDPRVGRRTEGVMRGGEFYLTEGVPALRGRPSRMGGSYAEKCLPPRDG